MFKLLLKKQMSEIFAFITMDRRRGKGRSFGGIIAYTLLYILLFVIIGFSIYRTASSLCKPLSALGIGWFCFALMGLASLAFGVIGSVFATYNALYVSKDNELLFSMPIKPRTILASRLVGVYLTGLIYVLAVMAPSIIAYFANCQISALGIAFSILSPFLLALPVLALSCLLGWLVSLVARRIRNKSFVTVVLSLVFVGGYYYLYIRSFKFFEKILENPFGLSNAVRSYIYPFYLMGQGCVGKIGSFALFSAICLAAFALVCFLLDRSFSRSVIAGSSVSAVGRKIAYSAKDISAGSLGSALLKKEFRRFVSSPIYMLNAGFGSLMTLIAAVALIVKGGSLAEALYSGLSVNSDVIGLIACAAVCLIAGTNAITASSVSLEGKNIWIAQSLPVPASSALMAKLKLHLAIALPPLMLLDAAMIAVMKLSPVFAVLVILSSVVFVLFIAVLGLTINLKIPNLHWTNEAIPVKQSLPAFIMAFAGIAAVSGCALLYALLGKHISQAAFVACVSAALLIAALLLLRWIRTRGARIFSELS